MHKQNQKKKERNQKSKPKTTIKQTAQLAPVDDWWRHYAESNDSASQQSFFHRGSRDGIPKFGSTTMNNPPSTDVIGMVNCALSKN